MALSLQESGIIAQDFPKWIGKMPGFADIKPEQLYQVIQYMADTGILHSDSGLLGIGRSGEQSFGQKNFMELFSVFTSPPMVKVFHGNRELGEVHQMTFMIKDQGPSILTLGGRSWKTKYIDWPRKKAYVEPTDLRGRSQWLSAGQPMHFEMCQAMAHVLSSESCPEQLSDRGKLQLETLQEEFDWVTPGSTTLQFDGDGNAIWWTFAGRLFNAAAMSYLTAEADKVSCDNLGICLTKVADRDALPQRIRAFLALPPEEVRFPLDEDFVKELKFAECLSQGDIDRELAARYRVGGTFARVTAMQLAVQLLKA